MNISELEVLQQIKRDADAAGHGGKEAVYEQACAQYAFTRSTLMRKLRSLQTVSTRKQRSDAGVVKLSIDDAKQLSSMLMAGYRANKKKIQFMQNSLDILRANGKGSNGLGFATWVDETTGEVNALSASACARALRTYKLHPTQLNAPAPAQQMQSLHPNHVWSIDASISTLFYVPDGGVADMNPAEFYKNKPDNFERIKRQRLTRWVITDHTSGCLYVHYVAGGESTASMAESFLNCIQKRADNPFHGVPFYLMFDPGSGGTSGAFGNLLHRLQVEPIVNKAGNPRAKGQVEKGQDLVETNFESSFKLKDMKSIDMINAYATRWMLAFNGTRKHTRHGLTRFSKWLEITPAQLRTVDADLARSLLTHKPLTPRVNDELQVQFAGRFWDVKKVPQVIVGEKLEVTYNPFDRSTAFVIMHDNQGGELLIEVPQVEKNNNGFPVNAPIIGQEYRRPADTVADTNRKMINRIMTDSATDEEAEKKLKGKAPAFGGNIDPYKHIENAIEQMPLHMPRTGEALEISTTVASKAPRVLNHFEAAKEVVSMGVEMSRERRVLIERLYPQGVPEDQLDQLKQQLTTAHNSRKAACSGRG